jgi:hypothetical protein
MIPSNSREQVGVLLLVSAALVALATWILYRYGRSRGSEYRERRRRHSLAVHGRIGEGTITDAHDNLLYYSYSVHGVAFSASQDISALRSLLPEDPSTLAGPVRIKYSLRNPANSIVLSEEWSGLRIRSEEPKGA